MSYETWGLEHFSAQLQHTLSYLTECSTLLFEIYQRNVGIEFENQQKYDALLCSKGLTQNSSLGVHQAKMTW